MVKAVATHDTTRVNRRQVLLLLILAVIFLLMAWVLKPNPLTYPVGVLLLGVGMLLAALLNPARLVIASCLTTALGVAVFLTFRQMIPGNQILSAYILAIGVGLLAIAVAGRQGYVKAGALSPVVIVLAVGIIEYLLAKGLTPSWLIPFALSLWLPGIGLLLLSIGYFLSDFRR